MTSDQTVTCSAPAASGDKMLYDESANNQTIATRPISTTRRITVDVFGDQIVTVFHEIQLTVGGPWHAVNGAGDATTASALFDKDYYFRAGLNRIRIHAGATPPTSTTFEAIGRLMEDRVSPT